MRRIAVIGAGMAGLVAARTLADRGAAVTVFDKGRGVGGRMATRRTAEGWTFDHGAPAAHGVSPDPAARLAGAAGEGGLVGLPGMSGLAAPLAAGLDLRCGVEVGPVERAGGGWRVQGEGFAAVVVAVPAPQAAALCAAAPRLVAAARAARMTACWTLLAAWDAPGDWAEGGAVEPAAAPFARIIDQDARPGRAAAPGGWPRRWVAHAAQDWTDENLELERPDACARLLPRLAAALGLDPAAALHAAAHRWRYARVAQAVGAPCVAEDGMVAAGDWVLGPHAGDAAASGLAAADALG
jgi:renalase